MEFSLRQINSLTVGEKQKEFETVIRSMFGFYSSNLSMDVFIKCTVSVMKQNANKWQLFYLYDTKQDEVVSSFIITGRDSLLPNTLHLLVGYVHTTPNYRKKGYVKDLISKCMSLYESFFATGKFDVTSLDEYFIKDTIEYLSKLFGSYKNSYWSLYSAISTYYERFGFTSVPTMNWFSYEFDKSTDEDLLAFQNQELCIEEYFNTSNIKIINEQELEYAAKLMTDDNNQSWSLKSVSKDSNSKLFGISSHSISLTDFIAHDRFLFRELNGKRNTFDIGIEISHQDINKKTFLIASRFLDNESLVVHRIFSNLSYDNKEESIILKEDLKKLVLFCKINLLDWNSNVIEKENDSLKVLLVTEDIWSTEKSTEDYIVNYLKSQWEYDDSNSHFLPMIKEFDSLKIDASQIVWLNKGFAFFG
ncbi:hypothetical protein B5S33_g3597 [[Candida] boidinii]|nr:hypothetical protein B5S30_g3812 [[Candida] boidinii]OWB84940.1 hypothetical protein B5S33_g3597 [[Candida] boidinii]GMF98701.1 unnamed protein product [[Candida] boidinii]